MQDLLSDILTRLSLRGTLYFRTSFTEPWGVRVPAFSNVARFHFVHRGECVVRVQWARQRGASRSRGSGPRSSWRCPQRSVAVTQARKRRSRSTTFWRGRDLMDTARSSSAGRSRLSRPNSSAVTSQSLRMRSTSFSINCHRTSSFAAMAPKPAVGSRLPLARDRRRSRRHPARRRSDRAQDVGGDLRTGTAHLHRDVEAIGALISPDLPDPNLARALTRLSPGADSGVECCRACARSRSVANRVCSDLFSQAWQDPHAVRHVMADADRTRRTQDSQAQCGRCSGSLGLFVGIRIQPSVQEGNGSLAGSLPADTLSSFMRRFFGRSNK